MTTITKYRDGLTRQERDELEAQERAYISGLPTPACPPWCEDGEGHPWEEVYPLSRNHCSITEIPTTGGDGPATIEIWANKESTDREFRACIYIAGGNCNSAEARLIAADLLRLADVAEENAS